MDPISEVNAERLEPVQAAELARVIEYQARWENLREDPAKADKVVSGQDLQSRQKAYEAFRTRLVAYSARYRTAKVPEVTMGSPARIAIWCRAVRAILRRAEQEPGSESPIHTMEKAYRLVDRIALRLKKEAFVRPAPPANIGAAIRDLDALIRNCSELDIVPSVAGKLPVERQLVESVPLQEAA